MQDLLARGFVGGGEGVDTHFQPDQLLADNETLHGPDWAVTALWTPGHMANHLCFAWQDALFTGDHVMGWASSLVSPPDGDLTQFMASCARLSQRRDRVYHSGHGAPILNPAERLDWLIAHRQSREADILAALPPEGASADDLTRLIYTDTPAALLPAASRNVFAHLIDLSGRGLVQMPPTPSPTSLFYRYSQRLSR